MPFLPIGGQAVIEGVMMRSPSRVAVAVRRPGGALAFDERPFASITRRVRGLGLPVVRGAVGLVETMMIGIAALNFSAEQASRDETAALYELWKYYSGLAPFRGAQANAPLVDVSGNTGGGPLESTSARRSSRSREVSEMSMRVPTEPLRVRRVLGNAMYDSWTSILSLLPW